MNDKVLVTGGAGFIGSHVAKILVENGYETVVLDTFEWGREKNLSDIDVEVVKGDIREETILDGVLEDIDGVFHLAAHVGNRRSIENPYIDADINVKGTLKLLEAATYHNISKLVVSSSAAIFGEVQYTPVDERHPVEPESPYGVTKLATEKHSLCYSRIHDLDIVCLRYFNVYGENQRYDEYGNVIPIWTHRLLDGEPLIIYGDGEQTRDFINVRDVARANLQAYEADEATGPINIGTGAATSINQLASIFKSVADREVETRYEPAREGEVKHSVADVSKADDQLDFDPNVGLEEGIYEYKEWRKSTNDA